MAELLGVVASGITLAQVVREIIGTYLKIKHLMNDYDEMPAKIESLLIRVEYLAPLVSTTSANNDTLPLEASLNGALHNATTHLRMALDQLKSMTETLSSQIEASRGIKRKFKLVKTLWKGDQVTRCERNLETAVQFLTLAQVTCVLALQRMQPEMIALQVLHHLEGRIGSLSQNSGKDILVSKSRNRVELRRKTRKLDSILSPEIRLGLPCITGTVEIYRSRREWDTKESLEEKGQAALLQFKFRLPTWLSSMVIDSTINRKYSGWTYCLEIHRTHTWNSTPMRTVVGFMIRDDVEGLRRMFQDRVIGPLDHFLHSANLEIEWSLFALSIKCRAWKTSRYLLQHGSEQLIQIPGPSTRQKDTPELRALLEDDWLQDNIRLTLLLAFKNIQDFSSLRRRILPDYEYWSSNFRYHRLELARAITCNLCAAPEVFRLVLSKSSHLGHDDIDFNWPECGNRGVLHGIAHVIGFTDWIDSHTSRDWHAVAGEVLQLVRRYETLSCIRWMSWNWFQSTYGSPFLALFEVSFRPTPINVPRKCKIQARLNACNRTLRVWLKLVKQAGFDLQQYGTREKRQLAFKELGDPQDFCIFQCDSYDGTSNFRMEIRLITFTYGSEVGDWKLWWSEPTDGLVGDFWREIDPEPLRIPGSWMGDDV
ncbi:hypothetical protein GGR58DRAFT_495734 [Xylaria digitata]|nr:hypothetical protein GGR58DRAFT_495734 [Xylaria digitata]